MGHPLNAERDHVAQATRRRNIRYAIVGALGLLVTAEVVSVVVHRNADRLSSASTVPFGDPVPVVLAENVSPTTTSPTAISPTATSPTAATTTAPDAAPGATTARPPAAPTSANDRPPVRWAVLQAGVITLHGAVPSAAVVASEVEKLASVVGAANVRQKYTVDAAVPVLPTSPLYLADTVTFAQSSSEVRPELAVALDLIGSLLKAYPTLRIIVVGHPDDAGVPASRALSSERVKAVTARLLSHGGSSAQVDGVSLETAAPSSGVGTGFDRHIDFLLTGLLGA